MPTAPPPALDVADARPNHWLIRMLPAALVPYAQIARWERPIGWWLLLLPCWWSLFLAQISAGQNQPHWFFAVLFVIGAIAMRGAGCTLNDLVDRDIDAAVARTKSRPLPSGRLSARQAVLFMALQALAGLIVLLQFNRFTIVLALASLVIVAVYPFMKRVTYYPQLVLGLAFNWGALLGWTAIAGKLETPALLVYAAGIFWTLGYDTIYAHQDKEDDALIGVKSTALKFGDASVYWIGGFYLATLMLLALAFYSAGVGVFSWLGLSAAALHGIWQIARFHPNTPELCLKLFKSNRTFGLLVALGLFMDIFR